jgi:hypothetical protein
LKKLIQLSYEEGSFMGALGKNILNMLDWPLGQLEEKVRVERIYSQVKFSLSPVDDLHFADKNPIVNIYITGDNTSQPDKKFAAGILDAQLTNRESIERNINRFDSDANEMRRRYSLAGTFTKLLIKCTSNVKQLEKFLSTFTQRRKEVSIAKKVEEISLHE